MKRSFLFDPIFKAHFILQKGGDLNKGIEYYVSRLKYTYPDLEPWKKLNNPDAHFTSYVPHKGGLLWFKDERAEACISHEAFHATWYVLTQTGLTLTDESEEAFAYYLEWLVDNIKEKLYSKHVRPSRTVQKSKHPNSRPNRGK